MEKEEWIDQVLNSTHGIAKAQPSELLFEKIQNRIATKVPPVMVWLVAASFLILLALNFKAIVQKSDSNQNEMAQLASSLDQNNQLY